MPHVACRSNFRPPEHTSPWDGVTALGRPESGIARMLTSGVLGLQSKRCDHFLERCFSGLLANAFRADHRPEEKLHRALTPSGRIMAMPALLNPAPFSSLAQQRRPGKPATFRRCGSACTGKKRRFR
jgi:hypothetical protein